MHGNILMKFITVMHYQVHITMTTFLDHGFRGQGHSSDVNKATTPKAKAKATRPRPRPRPRPQPPRPQ